MKLTGYGGFRVSDQDRDALCDAVRRAKGGDQAAFQELVARTQKLVRRMAYSALGPDLWEDAMQETYLVVFRRLEQLHNVEAFLAWLSRIVLSVCQRLRKKNPKTFELKSSGQAEDHSQSVADSVTLRRALSQLPLNDRNVLILYELVGLSHAEVAFALRIPVGTARSRLHTARGRLAERLEN